MATDAELWRLPYYHGLLPREDAVTLLKANGDFLIRKSEENAGDTRSFVLSIFYEGAPRHYIVRSLHGRLAIDFKKEKGYASIQAFVEHHLRSGESICEGRDVILRRGAKKQDWELAHTAVTRGPELGSGAFGIVRRGFIKKTDGTEARVAIKEATLTTCTKEQIKEFMNEARVMRKFCHPNVILSYGVAVGEEPLMIVMELATEGALKDYLQQHRRSMRSKLYMCMGAASGLNHIHERNVVHCDIASRNCLYSDHKVKIADFGLARELEPTERAIKLDRNQRLPIKWLAPETMIERACTKKSDVWAFGIMCWEIFANGGTPYVEVENNNAVAKMVVKGKRLKFPEGTPEEFAEFITTCVWNGDAEKRCGVHQAMIWMDKNIKRLTDGLTSLHVNAPAQPQSSKQDATAAPGPTASATEKTMKSKREEKSARDKSKRSKESKGGSKEKEKKEGNAGGGGGGGGTGGGGGGSKDKSKRDESKRGKDKAASRSGHHHPKSEKK